MLRKANPDIYADFVIHMLSKQIFQPISISNKKY